MDSKHDKVQEMVRKAVQEADPDAIFQTASGEPLEPQELEALLRLIDITVHALQQVSGGDEKAQTTIHHLGILRNKLASASEIFIVQDLPGDKSEVN